MPKRGYSEDTERDPPNVIANRRKAKVAARFRNKPGLSGSGQPSFPGLGQSAAAMPPPSSFSFGINAAQPGSSFAQTPAAVDGAQLPARVGGTLSPAKSTDSIVRGSTASRGLAGSIATGTGASVDASPDTSATMPTDAIVPAFKNVAQHTSATLPKDLRESGVPSRNVTDVSTKDAPPFGKGPTALQGNRLNKRFKKWLSHQIANNPCSSLDVGLRDYIAFAAILRDRAEFDQTSTSPAANVAFKHSAGTVDSNRTVSGTKPSSPFKPRSVAREAAPHVEGGDIQEGSRSHGHELFSLAPNQGSQSTVPSSPAPTISPAPAAAPLFSFGATAASSVPTSTSASKGFAIPGLATPPAPKAFTGFQLPIGGISTAGTANAVANGVAAEEDDGMPKEDPAKLERAAGEEDEEILHQVRAKLYRFKKNEKTWGDLGAGVYRLMKHNKNDKRRMILRNDMGKVLLNVALYADMAITRCDKGNTIKFVGNTDEGPTSLMIRVKKDDLEALHRNVEQALPSA